MSSIIILIKFMQSILALCIQISNYYDSTTSSTIQSTTVENEISTEVKVNYNDLHQRGDSH